MQAFEPTQFEKDVELAKRQKDLKRKEMFNKLKERRVLIHTAEDRNSLEVILQLRKLDREIKDLMFLCDTEVSKVALAAFMHNEEIELVRNEPDIVRVQQDKMQRLANEYNERMKKLHRAKFIATDNKDEFLKPKEKKTVRKTSLKFKPKTLTQPVKNPSFSDEDKDVDKSPEENTELRETEESNLDKYVFNFVERISEEEESSSSKTIDSDFEMRLVQLEEQVKEEERQKKAEKKRAQLRDKLALPPK